jgi:hypothetical protein
MVISIVKPEYLSDYEIRFYFSDGNEKVINFLPFLDEARNPMTRKYLDEKLFKDYSIQHGDIVWNNFEMCFPILELHEGII